MKADDETKRYLWQRYQEVGKWRETAADMGMADRYATLNGLYNNDDVSIGFLNEVRIALGLEPFAEERTIIIMPGEQVRVWKPKPRSRYERYYPPKDPLKMARYLKSRMSVSDFEVMAEEFRRI